MSESAANAKWNDNTIELQQQQQQQAVTRKKRERTKNSPTRRHRYKYAVHTPVAIIRGEEKVRPSITGKFTKNVTLEGPIGFKGSKSFPTTNDDPSYRRAAAKNQIVANSRKRARSRATFHVFICNYIGITTTHDHSLTCVGV